MSVTATVNDDIAEFGLFKWITDRHMLSDDFGCRACGHVVRNVVCGDAGIPTKCPGCKRVEVEHAN